MLSKLYLRRQTLLPNAALISPLAALSAAADLSWMHEAEHNELRRERSVGYYKYIIMLFGVKALLGT